MKKLLYRLKKIIHVFLTEFFSPFVEKSQLFYFLSIPLLIFILSGFEEYLLDTENNLLIIILTIPFWLLVCLFIAPFKMIGLEKKIGYWENDEFIFHKPMAIKTVKLKTEYNSQNFRFKIKDAPSNSFVNFKVEYEGGLNHLVIKPHENQESFGNESRNTTYSVRLNSKKETVYEVCAKNNSVDTVCYISVISWRF